MKSAVLLLVMYICLYNRTAVSDKMLQIKGLNPENLRNKNGTIITYKFKHGEKFDLTCLKKPTRYGKYHLTWDKSGQNLTTKYSSEDELKQHFLLHDVDNGTIITCRLDEEVDQNGEDLAPHHENISIVLLYEKYITDTNRSITVQTEMALTPEPTDPVSIHFDKDTLIFGSCAVVAIIIIIIILICIIIKQSRKKNTPEDKKHLRTANSSVRSQSSESVTKIDATYSSPRDATDRNGVRDPTIHCNVYQSDIYSMPFSETREIYSVPIPKKFRSLKTPKNYTYAKTYQNGYSNVSNSPNRKEYENLSNHMLSDAPSSLYSEINN